MKFTVFRMHKQKTTIHSHLMHAIHYFCVDRKRRVENVKTNQEARKSIEIEKCCPIDSRSTVGAKNQASIFGVFWWFKIIIFSSFSTFNQFCWKIMEMYARKSWINSNFWVLLKWLRFFRSFVRFSMARLKQHQFDSLK